MAITTSNIRNTYTATGGQTEFTYTFELFDEAEIEVYQNSVLQSLTTDYTVAGVGDDAGGTVTLTSGATNGDTIVLLRNTATTRSTDFQQNGAWLASTTNTEFDRVWAKIQETESNSSTARVVKLQDTDEDADLDLPLKATRANKFLFFNSDGDVATQQTIGDFEGTWANTTLYQIGDVIIDGANGNDTDNVYYCNTAHTSGTFGTDLSSGKWDLIVDVQQIRTDVAANVQPDIEEAAIATVLIFN